MLMIKYFIIFNMNKLNRFYYNYNKPKIWIMHKILIEVLKCAI